MLARLQAANLPYDELVRVAAELCEQLPQARLKFDALLSQQTPLPEWAINSVLMSADLIAHLFASLEMPDSAAACVCKAWRQAWADTADQRRGLRSGRQLAQSGSVPWWNGAALLSLAAHPNGDWIAIHLGHGDDMYIVNPDMQLIHSFDVMNQLSNILVTEDFIFTTVNGVLPGIIRYEARMPFTKLDEYEPPEGHNFLGFEGMAIANGVLYAAAWVDDYEDEDKQDELFALDAHTLELRFRFGRGAFRRQAFGMAIVGEELYVCDSHARCLRVFSLAGEQLREVRGDWRVPKSIRHFDGRLYLHEMDTGEEGFTLAAGETTENWPDTEDVAGQRIFVLAPDGQTLQVWHASGDVNAMGFWRHELIVSEGGVLEPEGGVLDTLVGI